MSTKQAQKSSLSAKDQQSFKLLNKLYEEKQYKKAVKTADQILKNSPDHGETMAYKGLVTYHLGEDRKEEAYELIKKALKLDLRSFLCWHVYGIVCKMDNNFREAIKCYTNALKLEKENYRVANELAALQTQVRDYEGLVTTRQQILAMRSNLKANWIGLAMAADLAGNRELALQTIDSYLITLLEPPPESEAYEHSELLLFKAQLLEELGRLDACLKALDQYGPQIRDRVAVMEQRARIALKQARFNDARKAYEQLLVLNTDNVEYHKSLWQAMQLPTEAASLTAEQRDVLQGVYKTLQASHPRSTTCRLLPLDFLEGPAFEAAAREFCTAQVKKGIPSLFVSLRHLYRSPAKAQFFDRLFKEFVESPPTPEARVWCLHLLAGHLDHVGRHEAALESLTRAIDSLGAAGSSASDESESKSTRLDLLLLKAKVLKHAGDVNGAAEAADEARRLDLADRFTNTVAVKHLLRAGCVERALTTADLFVKEDMQTNNTVELQISWLENRTAAAHLRAGDCGRTLKESLSVLKHYHDFVDDQFDFHGYCIRKQTMRAYREFLHLEDRIASHRHFAQAACTAIECYLRLHDAPSVYRKLTAEEALEERLKDLPEAEKKKARQHRKKEEERKAAAEEAERAAKEKAAAKAGKAYRPPKKDADPEGIQLTRVEDPLGEAAKIAAQLLQFNAARPDAQCMAFEVALRQGKLLQAAQCLQTLRAIEGADSPQLAPRVVRLAVAAAKAEGVSEVVKTQVGKLLDGAGSASDYAARYVKSSAASASLSGYAAGVVAQLASGAVDQAAAAKLVLGNAAFDQLLDGESTWHKEAVAVLEVLQKGGVLATAAEVEQFRARAAKRFPRSVAFGGSQASPAPAGTLEGALAALKV